MLDMKGFYRISSNANSDT